MLYTDRLYLHTLSLLPPTRVLGEGRAFVRRLKSPPSVEANPDISSKTTQPIAPDRPRCLFEDSTIDMVPDFRRTGNTMACKPSLEEDMTIVSPSTCVRISTTVVQQYSSVKRGNCTWRFIERVPKNLGDSWADAKTHGPRTDV